jgi:hypothetical protein
MVSRVSEDALKSAWCTDCGWEYPAARQLASTSGNDRPGCSRCKSQRVAFGMEFVASLGLDGTFTAYQPPGPTSKEAIRHSPLVAIQIVLQPP